MSNSRVRIPTPASSTPPTGDPNTVAFFNGGGTLSDSLTFAFLAASQLLGINQATPKSRLHTVSTTTTGTVGADSYILGQPHSTNPIGAGAFIQGLQTMSFVAGNTARGESSVSQGYGTVAQGFLNYAYGNLTTASAGDSRESFDIGFGGAFAFGSGGSALANGCASFGGAIVAGYRALGLGTSMLVNANLSAAFGVTCRTGNVRRTFTFSSPTITIAGGDFTSEFTSGFATISSLTGGTNNRAWSRVNLSIINLAYNIGPNTTTFDLVDPTQMDDRTGGQVHDGIVGGQSLAHGTSAIATGLNSFSGGNNSQATGANSSSHGNTTIAQGQAQTVLGQFNIAQGTTADTDDIFQIGTGTGTGASRYTGLSQTKHGLLRIDAPVIRPKTLQSVAAGNTVAITESIAGITRRKSYIKIDSAGAVTLSVVTAIASGDEEGQSIWITNEGTFNISIPDAANTQHYTAATFILQPKATVQYIWTGTLWRAVGSLLY